MQWTFKKSVYTSENPGGYIIANRKPENGPKYVVLIAPDGLVLRAGSSWHILLQEAESLVPEYEQERVLPKRDQIPALMNNPCGKCKGPRLGVDIKHSLCYVCR